MKLGKGFLVVFGAVMLSTLGISATDTWRGASDSLLGSLIVSEQSVCPTGMREVPTARTFTCVDEYEATPNDTCRHQTLVNDAQTRENLSQRDCAATSRPAEPWRFITREQAALACTRAGKRLPTAAEWYSFALGTPAAECNIDSASAASGGDYTECQSPFGVRHAVGNVWEWVSDDVVEGEFADRSIPESGYVVQVDSAGVAVETNAEAPTENFGPEYFTSNRTGSFGMMRGGFYSSRLDAGVYNVHAAINPTFTGTAVGFRCVR